MYSSALWLRAESPGPIFKEGNADICDMSEVVGDTKGVPPLIVAAFTRG